MNRPSRSGPIFSLLDAVPTLMVAAVALVALWGTVRAGLAWMPLVFAFWDDEGFFLLALQSVLDGRPLYDETYSQYGPFYYLVAVTAHRLTGVPVTHDGSRAVMLVLWLVAALLTSWSVGRLTRSVAWAIVTLLPLAASLPPSGLAPGLAQWLTQVMVSTAILLATFVGHSARWQTRLLVLIGVLAACVTFTKINVGTYLVTGVGLALLSVSRGTRSATALFAVGTTAAAALPFVVMREHLAYGLTTYATVTSIAIVACALAARAWLPALALRPGAYLLVAGSFLAVGASICALTWLGGTSLGGLVRGMVVWPSRLGGIFLLPPSFPGYAVTVAALSGSTCAGLCAWRAWRGDTPTFGFTLGVIRAVVGALAIYAWLYHMKAFPWFAVAFVWIVLVPPRRFDDARSLGRATLAFVAVMEFLYAYPTAGAQMQFATYLLVPALVLCLADVVTAVTAVRSPSHPAARLAMGVAGAAALAWYVQWSLPKMQPPPLLAGFERLDQPGARRIVAALPGEAAKANWVTANLRAHCDTFVSKPGFDSYYFWSGLKPPTGLNAGAWMILLDDVQQERVIAALDRFTRTCAIRDRSAESFWLRGLATPKPAILAGPLVQYIDRHFVPVAVGFGREFMLPKNRAAMPFENFLLFGEQTFDGARSLPVPVEAFAGPPRKTVSAWFRTDAAGVLLGCHRREGFGPVQDASPFVYVGRDGRLRGQLTKDPQRVIATPHPVTDGGWHRVDVVVLGGDQTLYLDGEPVGSLASAGDLGKPNACQIGGGYATGWPSADEAMPFRGMIADVSVTDGALSAIDLRARFTAGQRGAGAGAQPSGTLSRADDP